MNRKETILTLFISILCLLAAFAAGYIYHGTQHPPELELPILSEARRILLENAYYDPPPDPALEYGMIHGMVQAYDDPYTLFVEPPQHELEIARLEGHFGGIGVRLGRDSENFIVVYPYPDSPALEAGIQKGDRLISVDDDLISQETNLEHVQAILYGSEGKRVKVVIQRPPEYATFEFSIQRKDIPLPSVTWHLSDLEPRLGVVEINLIAASTPDEIVNAVNDMQSRGATHFVLDLRGNSGGLLEAGVDVVRLFLESGEIINQQFRDEEEKVFRVRKTGELADIPIAIIVDHYTASAAEIIAGALQSQGRSVLVGSPTYGKYSVQLIFNLTDGSSIHVTAGKWWIPGLEFPSEGYGLIPDIGISPDEENPNTAIELVIQTFFSGD